MRLVWKSRAASPASKRPTSIACWTPRRKSARPRRQRRRVWRLNQPQPRRSPRRRLSRRRPRESPGRQGDKAVAPKPAEAEEPAARRLPQPERRLPEPPRPSPQPRNRRRSPATEPVAAPAIKRASAAKAPAVKEAKPVEAKPDEEQPAPAKVAKSPKETPGRAGRG